ncbi:D-glycero-beta-D-manno-heptose-7-phosphate kinase [Candidatus Omnitrophota bacterium]
MRNIKKIISKFSKTNILVIGDLILDRFIWGTVERISPEAPVPVVLQQNLPSHMPGGAANVAHNLNTLGANVTIVGKIGRDQEGKQLVDGMRKFGINTAGVFVDKQIPTIVKTRIFAQHQQVVRLDREVVAFSENDLVSKKISNFIANNIDSYDGIIVEDYGKGIINEALLDRICPLARARNKIITVDPKEEHFGYYRGVTAITPNHKEAENAIRNLKIRGADLKINRDKLTRDDEIDCAGKELLEHLGLEAVLITLGDKGMRLFQKGKEPFHIDTVAKDVFDVTGAGDTVIAVFTLALASGVSMKNAALLSNYAAGIVVGRIGIVAITADDIIESVKDQRHA